MEKLLQTLITGALLVVLFYASAAFIELEPNPIKWRILTRVIFVFFFVLFVISRTEEDDEDLY